MKLTAEGYRTSSDSASGGMIRAGSAGAEAASDGRTEHGRPPSQQAVAYGGARPVNVTPYGLPDSAVASDELARGAVAAQAHPPSASASGPPLPPPPQPQFLGGDLTAPFAGHYAVHRPVHTRSPRRRGGPFAYDPGPVEAAAPGGAHGGAPPSQDFTCDLDTFLFQVCKGHAWRVPRPLRACCRTGRETAALAHACAWCHGPATDGPEAS